MLNNASEAHTICSLWHNIIKQTQDAPFVWLRCNLPPCSITANSGQSVSVSRKKKEKKERTVWKNELRSTKWNYDSVANAEHFMFIVACFIHLIVISFFLAPAAFSRCALTYRMAWKCHCYPIHMNAADFTTNQHSVQKSPSAGAVPKRADITGICTQAYNIYVGYTIWGNS